MKFSLIQMGQFVTDAMQKTGVQLVSLQAVEIWKFMSYVDEYMSINEGEFYTCS